MSEKALVVLGITWIPIWFPFTRHYESASDLVADLGHTDEGRSMIVYGHRDVISGYAVVDMSLIKLIGKAAFNEGEVLAIGEEGWAAIDIWRLRLITANALEVVEWV